MRSRPAAQGVKAVSVYSDSQVRRNQALQWLESRQVDIIFSVDLFNEGTDLPAIDTILMIRPTESKILFLQQIGRGLRLCSATQKQKVVILDFIGNHDSFLNRATTLYQAGNLKEALAKHANNAHLPDGCYINFDLALLNFWQSLVKQMRSSVQEEYQQLSHQLAHRPTASEFFYHGIEMKKVRRQAQSWFQLVASQENDPVINTLVEHYGDFLLRGVETTSMTKSFKAILLEALLELDGLRHPPTLTALAQRSRLVFERYPDLMALDLSPKTQKYHATDEGWLKYWQNNPIKAFTNSSNRTPAWFTIDDQQRFVPTFIVDSQDIEPLHDAIQELVDLRLAEYKQRHSTSQKETKLPATPLNVVGIPSPVEHTETALSGTELPFYPELKIACGSFKNGSASHTESYLVPDGYGTLSAQRHFVAPASGNSMNGGKNPIQDGDLLLLEWITPDSAGSISGLTLAIERQDESGDNQYLLRTVRKIAPNQYELIAQNPDYANLPATDQMRTFARLKAILKHEYI